MKIVVSQWFTEEIEKKILAGLQDGAGPNTRISPEFVGNIPVEPSGKRRLVISKAQRL